MSLSASLHCIFVTVVCYSSVISFSIIVLRESRLKREINLLQTFVDMTRYRSIRVAVDPPTSPWVKSDHTIYLRQGGLGLFREENVTNIVGIAHIAAMCQPESITYSSVSFILSRELCSHITNFVCYC